MSKESKEGFITENQPDGTRKPQGLLQKTKTIKENIDFNVTMRKYFYFLISLACCSGIAAVALLTYWWATYFGGFDWSNIHKRFGFHPLLMVSGLIVILGNNAIVYRVLRYQEKMKVKILHTVLHVLTAIFVVVGLYAAFSVNSQLEYGNMYSLHSWFGILTVSLFFAQLVFGFLAFLFPRFEENFLANYMPQHRYFGMVIFLLAIATAVMGITEQMLLS